MAWVRIDDEFYDHPKWASAPGDSIALWLASMAWCNRNESWDGYIPASKLGGLVNVRNAKRTAADLCERRAFVAQGDGYVIHEYAEYQQNEKIRKIRAARSEAGRKGAESRWGKDGKPIATAMANEWQTDGNENAPPPTSHRPSSLDTPPTTTTSHCDLPSAVAVVKAIVDVEFESAGHKRYPAKYRQSIQDRIEHDYGPLITEALEADPLLTEHALAAIVLNGHAQRIDILDLLEPQS